MGIMMIAGTERRRQGCSLQDGKQWGTNTTGSRTTRTEAYPLPYSEFCMPIVSGKGYVGGLNYGFGVGVTNFGLTSVTIANNSEDSSYRWTGYTYIVVGAQPQWGKPTVRGNNIFPIHFPNSALAITSAGIGGWHTVDVSIVNNNSYSVLGWATDSPSTARTSLPNVIAIGF